MPTVITLGAWHLYFKDFALPNKLSQSQRYGKILCPKDFSFSSFHYTIISYQTLGNTLHAFSLCIFRFFRLENNFYNFGPGVERAGSVADDSISWLFHPRLTA